MYLKRSLKPLTNMWRRFKYFFIYLSLLFLLYLYFVARRASLYSAVKKSSVNLEYVTVHFDLKGSPPKISYLVNILPILSMYGVNSILMEYEDMFPYEGSIVNISSVNSYSRSEVSFDYNINTVPIFIYEKELLWVLYKSAIIKKIFIATHMIIKEYNTMAQYTIAVLLLYSKNNRFSRLFSNHRLCCVSTYKFRVYGRMEQQFFFPVSWLVPYRILNL